MLAFLSPVYYNLLHFIFIRVVYNAESPGGLSLYLIVTALHTHNGRGVAAYAIGRWL